MANLLKTIIILLLLFMAVVYFSLPNIILKMITDYEPYTFEYVLNDPKLISEYGIYDNQSPEDYHHISEVVRYHSIDGTRLIGWYVPAKRQTRHCMIFAHGRTSNRLKTMKYLSLIDSLQLDTIYNVFLPDLRNSGQSASSKTYMGYKFGEDLAASINYMSQHYKQDTFLLYGFSMGAMAILNATNRLELTSGYGEHVHIEKIIIDSPLVNVKETLRIQIDQFPGASIFFDKVFSLYSSQINEFGERMKISALLDPEIPIMIIQSKNDLTTRFEILEDELRQMPPSENLHLVLFEGPGHVKLFQDERTRMRYIKEVRKFLMF